MKDPMLMRLFSSFLFPSLVVLGPVATAIAALLWASVAGAAATYTAVATTSLGNPLNALEIGELVTIDVTLRSDGEATIGLSASATGYDPDVR